MLTGQVPFDADTPMAMLTSMSTSRRRRRAALNPQPVARVETVLLRALEKDPARATRPPAEMAADWAQAVIRLKRAGTAQLPACIRKACRRSKMGGWIWR